MGIVVSCPSGHRMKVKDYLAGKKGICPTCGARFQIPHPAAAPAPVAVAAAAPRETEPVAAAAPMLATIVSLDPAAAAGLPELLLFAAGDTLQIDPDPTADLQIDEDDDGGAGDVLYWYFAIPGGQPSAALREPDMLAWLDSGQPTGREVVWRSDWPGWKPIGEAFPERFPAAFPGLGRR
jgi:hypothetical protein